MKIAVVSGKGGTGKTTIATSLALALSGTEKVWLVDCDVEAPNAHLFVQPKIRQKSQAVTLIPHVKKEHCTLCGECVAVCQFHALAKVGQSILVFPQLCHGCGSCAWNCPEKTIDEIPNPIGDLEAGETPEGMIFLQGRLTISEPMATPVIRQLKRWKIPEDNAVVIMDAPPGASCAVVETMRGADFALLVTEPTPFGQHDLQQILGIVGETRIPAAVIINRDGIAGHSQETFKIQHDLPELMRIPFDPVIAAGIAAGKTLIDIEPEFKERFLELFQRITLILQAGVEC